MSSSRSVNRIEPLLRQPRTVADLCRLTGYAEGTVGAAVAVLNRLGRLDVQKVNRGFGAGSGPPYAVYRLKTSEVS